MSRGLNRRDALKASAASAAAAGFWLTGGVESAETGQTRSPNERLNIAFVGAGGRAGGNIDGCSAENIVALCDVDGNRARGAFNRYPNATKYEDFRVMLERQRNIDAVVVSTPDHTHFHAAAAALSLGKHVYCEKPLTHTVWEARQLQLLARRHRVATQMGNQGTSMDGLRTAAEVLRAGVIGQVTEVHVWTNRPGNFWRQGHANRPAGMPPVPDTLKWDLWLGPAPERPFHPDYVPFAWRGWWDFGTGAVGDMGCHTMNLAFMGLQLGAPTAVEAVCDNPNNNESPPNGLIVTYHIPARGNRNALQIKWYESRRPPQELLEGERMVTSGSLFIGTRGKLYSPSDYGSDHVLLPRPQFQGYRHLLPTMPRAGGRHHQEWITACKGGPAAMSNFIDYSGPLTELVLLGNVAIRAGQRIEWDSARLQATNCPAAAQYIRREYRRGWEHTGLPIEAPANPAPAAPATRRQG